MLVKIRASIAGLLLASLAACATPGPVLTTSVTAMRATVATTRTETVQVFGGINAAVREGVIQALLEREEPPEEAHFGPVASPELIARWDNAFAQLDAYFAGLIDLVSPGRAAVTTERLQAVGTALQSGNIGAKLPQGSAEVFAQLGGRLVQLAAERRAQAIMLEVDPAFRTVVYRLADLIANDVPGTLRHASDLKWEDELTRLARIEYPLATTAEARERVVRAYAEQIDKRDAQRAALDRLAQSLRALAMAHSEAAKGNDAAVFYWIGEINAALQAAREAAEKED